jgi:hypothetical protein
VTNAKIRDTVVYDLVFFFCRFREYLIHFWSKAWEAFFVIVGGV